MATEIERKFLVADEGWRPHVVSSRHLRQFYLATDGPSSIRIRITDGRKARLTIKSATSGMSRAEFDYEIPLDDAKAMLPLAVGSVIDKERHVVMDDGQQWEIDVFQGSNDGLVVAEIELASTNQRVGTPAWLGREVTDDERYYNAALVHHPFNTW